MQCKNPQFRVIVVHDSTFYYYLPELKESIPPEILSRLIGQHNADLYRIQILNKYGGVYTDVDSFPIGSFWPWYRKLLDENYDMVSTNWGNPYPISIGHIGPTRANVSIFNILSAKQIDVIQNNSHKLEEGKPYPLSWTALINNYLPEIVKEAIEQNLLQYYQIDGPNSVGQLVMKGLEHSVAENITNVKDKITNMTWAPILYWHHSNDE